MSNKNKHRCRHTKLTPAIWISLAPGELVRGNLDVEDNAQQITSLEDGYYQVVWRRDLSTAQIERWLFEGRREK